MLGLSGAAFPLTGEFICLAFLMDLTPPLLISLTLHRLVLNSLQFLGDLCYSECLQAEIYLGTSLYYFCSSSMVLDAPRQARRSDFDATTAVLTDRATSATRWPLCLTHLFFYLQP